MYNQRDAKWKNQRLGTCNGVTIGTDGCYDAVLAQIITEWGYNITPAQLDDQLTNKNLYVSGSSGACLMPDTVLHTLYPEVTSVGAWSYKTVPADLSKLNCASDEKVIIGLDFDHNPANGIQGHFVKLESWNGKDLIIGDPWYGTVDNFAKHYGTNPSQTIIKIIKYKNTKQKETDMLPIDKTKGRFYNYNEKIFYWIPDPVTANKYFPDWNKTTDIRNVVPNECLPPIKCPVSDCSSIQAVLDSEVEKLRQCEVDKISINTQLEEVSKLYENLQKNPQTVEKIVEKVVEKRVTDLSKANFQSLIKEILSRSISWATKKG